MLQGLNTYVAVSEGGELQCGSNPPQTEIPHAKEISILGLSSFKSALFIYVIWWLKFKKKIDSLSFLLTAECVLFSY